jgi:hypothetical protein
MPHSHVTMSNGMGLSLALFADDSVETSFTAS